MSREGEGRRPALLEPPKRSPRPPLLPTVSLPLLSALPVCRLPQRRDRVPSGAGYSFQSTASQGRAGG
jgi:hypothetical protein